jgi:hypothetical protein
MQGMINLGLHAFDAQGKFVGFGSIISQIYPKLKGLTQQQQLAVLSSIGLKSQGKALLDTFKAGPAAWDKAAQAVARHGSAQKAADAATSNLRGSEAKLRAALADVGVEFGQKLLPIVVKVAAELARAMNFVLKHKEILIAFAAVIGGVVAIGLAAFAVNMTTKFIGSISRAGKALGSLIDKLPTFGAKSVAASEEVATGADSAGTQLTLFGETAETTGEESSMAFGPVGIAIMAVVAIGILLMTHWKEVKKIASEVWGEVKRLFDDFMVFIKRWGPLIAEIILAPFTGGMSLIVPMLVKHWAAISRFFSSIPGKIVTLLGSGLTLLKRWGTDLLHGLLDGVKAYANLLFDFYIKLPLKLLGYLGDGLKVLAKWGGDLIHGILNGIDSFATSLWHRIEAFPGKILGWLGKGASVLAHWGEELIKGIIHGLEHGMSSLLGFVKGIPGKILGGLGHLGGGLVSGVASLFAEGGLVTAPTLSMIGEKGPELVLPLTDPNRMNQLINTASSYLPASSAGAGGAGGGALGGIPSSMSTIYAIDQLVIVANNPPELEQQLAQRARVSALSSKPSGASNLGIAV